MAEVIVKLNIMWVYSINFLHNTELRTHKFLIYALNYKIIQNNESNIYIIPIWGWETSTKTKRIVSSTDATPWYYLDRLTSQNLNIIEIIL